MLSSPQWLKSFLSNMYGTAKPKAILLLVRGIIEGEESIDQFINCLIVLFNTVNYLRPSVVSVLQIPIPMLRIRLTKSLWLFWRVKKLLSARISLNCLKSIWVGINLQKSKSVGSGVHSLKKILSRFPRSFLGQDKNLLKTGQKCLKIGTPMKMSRFWDKNVSKKIHR